MWHVVYNKENDLNDFDDITGIVNGSVGDD